MTLIRVCLLFLFFTFAEKCNAKKVAYTAIEDGKLKLFTVQQESEIPIDHVGKATFQNKINTTGWGFLEITTSEKHNDEGQAYSAGLLEGYLTYDLIWMNYINTMRDICKDKEEACDKIGQFIIKNLQWMRNMIHYQGKSNPYWYQVKLYLEQLEGIAVGYNEANNDTKNELTKEQILGLNLQFDMEDLFAKMGVKKVLGDGRCSALIKILPDYSDIYVSQVAWTGYHTMLRIQKKYSLKYKISEEADQIIFGHTMSFSSYPGQAFSGDDFYIISSGLVTLETTIGNNNDALWNNTQPVGQVMEFIRAMVANRLANSGVSWTTTLKKYNSGTYNNQWMVLDYTKFKPGNKKPKPGLLWILEQLPGIVKMQDMTDHLLEESYWASYNIAYFPLIFNMSGTPDEVAKFGDWFTYDKHPRALIFKRDHVNVKNMDDMLALMRYNDFKHDPLSKCECNPPYSGENAIAARNDLNLPNGTYPFRALSHRNHGATDVKITNYNLSHTYQFLGVSGPTYNESRGIPKFQWDQADFAATVPHLGHPNVWNFDPVIWKWQEFGLNLQFDIGDLLTKFGNQKVLGEGRCSALIKILPDYSDIYVSHVAWTKYQTMLRIQKKYSLKYKISEEADQIIFGHTMSFSSYPGQAFSGDDFYIISSGLVTMETTIGNYNDALWNNTRPVGQVMEFIRAMVANRLANSGVSWTTTLKKYNSGTYNNQWMVLDYTKFKPGNKKPKPGLLWILEQLPGIVKMQDMTDHLLEESYWASYNIAYFPLIFNMSGTPDEVAKFGDWFTYDKHPRALIFKRDHVNVKNMDDMLALMRYNDFKHDPLSKCECNPPYSGVNAIAARGDLDLPNGTYPSLFGHRNHGATDVKITNYNLSHTYQFLGVSGPTYNESRGIPKFQWDQFDLADTVSHLGHPNVWDFDPVLWKWQEL